MLNENSTCVLSVFFESTSLTWSFVSATAMNIFAMVTSKIAA